MSGSASATDSAASGHTGTGEAQTGSQTQEVYPGFAAGSLKANIEMRGEVGRRVRDKSAAALGRSPVALLLLMLSARSVIQGNRSGKL